MISREHVEANQDYYSSLLSAMVSQEVFEFGDGEGLTEDEIAVQAMYLRDVLEESPGTAEMLLDRARIGRKGYNPPQI